MKYIFISGGVISGIGKGIATASIALLLKAAGYRVSPLKIDPYLNVDAGTMNPIHHGEVFVLDDGSETDQDLGHYERFLNESLAKENFATSGQIYLSVLQKERSLFYDGECVEAVPHIPEEFLRRVEEAGRKRAADIVLVEIGGTVGEFQNVFIFESNRILKLKKSDDCLHIHLSYLPIPPSIGEMKSKPVQMSVKELNSMGIQPDILLARSGVPLDQSRKRKLSLFCALEPADIISAPDVDNIYQVPLNFEKGNLTERILKKLKLKRKKTDLVEWRGFVESSNHSQDQVKIGMVGKYFSTGDFTLTDSYVSVIEAIKHACFSQNLKPDMVWIDAGQLEKTPSLLSDCQGIIVLGGFGSRDVEGKITAVKYARENNIPYLGLCYGLQLAVVEYARNVLRLQRANSTEINPKTKYPVISVMSDQAKKLLSRDYGGTMRLGEWECVLEKRSKVRTVYGKDRIWERHRHRYEFNNGFRKKFAKSDLKIVGTTPDGKLVEVMELDNHPFFVGTQFHPELKSRPLSPHPLFTGFIGAASKIGT